MPALTRGWSLEIGKKRRLKLSATRTACSGGGGSSSVALAAPPLPPPLPPPGPPPPRLLARLAAAPGAAATVAAIFFSHGHTSGSRHRTQEGTKITQHWKREGLLKGGGRGGRRAHASLPVWPASRGGRSEQREAWRPAAAELGCGSAGCGGIPWTSGAVSRIRGLHFYKKKQIPAA